MTYETEYTTVSSASAERQYFDAYYTEYNDEFGTADEGYNSHFDAYSTFDPDDYEYQQDLAMMY